MSGTTITTSTLYLSETNGTARACRRVKEGTATVMHGKIARYVVVTYGTCMKADGKTPYEMRCTFRRTSDLVRNQKNYTPVSFKDDSRLHQFGKKMLTGIFIDYLSHAEGG